MLHLAQQVGKEKQLTIAGAGDERIFRVSVVLKQETGVFKLILSTHSFQMPFLTFAVGWVRQHEVKLARAEDIVGKRGVSWPTDDIVCGVAFALEKEISFANGVGFGVDLLSVQMRGHFLTV